MNLTSYGRREWLTAGLAALAAAAASIPLQAPAFGAAALVLGLAVSAFFRDPDRALPEGPGLFTAPADGLVDDIATLSGDEACALLGCDRVHRIGIFLSVFDVHINRAPCDLAVTRDAHRPGGYLDARNGNATRLNEAHTLVGTASGECGRVPVMVRQIAGRIARRIVCEARPGDVLRRGQRYGMIKFGSRTELYLPAVPGIEIVATRGVRVRGGIDILARFRPAGA